MKKVNINEGLAMLAFDYAMAIRIIKYLWQGFDQTDAYKLGIIDAEGALLKSPETVEEKSAYSPFVRLVLNLKKLIAKVPGGQSKIGSMIAAYALMRESVATEEEGKFLDDIMAPVLVGEMNIYESLSRFIPLEEDGAPVNVTTGATSPAAGGYDVPLNTKGKKPTSIVNRKKTISTLEPTVTKVKPTI